MKENSTTSDLKQRVFSLGYQKLEEESLFEKMREAIRPSAKRPTLRRKRRNPLHASQNNQLSTPWRSDSAR